MLEVGPQALHLHFLPCETETTHASRTESPGTILWRSVTASPAVQTCRHTLRTHTASTRARGPSRCLWALSTGARTCNQTTAATRDRAFCSWKILEVPCLGRPAPRPAYSVSARSAPPPQEEQSLAGGKKKKSFKKYVGGRTERGLSGEVRASPAAAWAGALSPASSGPSRRVAGPGQGN